MATSPRSVLVVDDDQDVLVLLDHALTPHNFEVTTAHSLQEAVHKLDGKRFDAVVTDKNMPGGSGIELIQGVAMKYPDTVAILMTAFPEGGTHKLAIDGYLPKPFKSLDVVRDTLERALERRALRRQLDSVQAGLQRSSPSGERK